MSVFHFVNSSATFAPMLVKAGFYSKIGCASDLRTIGERSASLIKSDTNAHSQNLPPGACPTTGLIGKCTVDSTTPYSCGVSEYIIVIMY